MRKILLATALLGAIAVAAAPAMADESQLTLKPGPGSDTTAATCAACHSIDYIAMNSPFQSPDTWTAEVTKMRKVFGAPIDDDTAKEILAYLIKYYGAGAAP
jgi:mono/diheme cytochrome c family protein